MPRPASSRTPSGWCCTWGSHGTRHRVHVGDSLIVDQFGIGRPFDVDLTQIREEIREQGRGAPCARLVARSSAVHVDPRVRPATEEPALEVRVESSNVIRSTRGSSTAEPGERRARRTPKKKHALVVRGGWDGHQPVEATDPFIPFLREHGFDVRVEDAAAVFADADYMAGVDLVVQCVTMSDDRAATRWPACAPRSRPAPGWPAGTAGSSTPTATASDYLQLVGGQFAAHPGKAPGELAGEQSDNYVPHTIEIAARARPDHPITAGPRRTST